MKRGSIRVQCGSIRVWRGSIRLQCGLIRVWRGSMEVGRLAVWQARVRLSDWHPIEASFADRRSDEDTRIQASENDEG